MNPFNRIVGGDTAPSPIPWQASIRQCPHGVCHYCGGTILDSQTILTAAHCQVMPSDYVMVGHVNRLEGQNIQVSEVINGDWNQYTMNEDIAIVKLATPLNMDDDVQGVCLPSPDFNPPAGSICYVSGWGTLQESGGPLPAELQYVDVPVVSQSSCNIAYDNFITSNMICAGFDEGGKDSCQGDSGGPFVCMENDVPVITGIVSFGIGCAQADYPGVYTRVSPYVNWIKSNMQRTTTAVPPTNVRPRIGLPPTCGLPGLENDGFCDDENNNAECDYDGGDCCGLFVNTEFCIECECKVNNEAPTSNIMNLFFYDEIQINES